MHRTLISYVKNTGIASANVRCMPVLFLLLRNKNLDFIRARLALRATAAHADKK